jgi:hypothetical protein
MVKEMKQILKMRSIRYIQMNNLHQIEYEYRDFASSKQNQSDQWEIKTNDHHHSMMEYVHQKNSRREEFSLKRNIVSDTN